MPPSPGEHETKAGLLEFQSCLPARALFRLTTPTNALAGYFQVSLRDSGPFLSSTSNAGYLTGAYSIRGMVSGYLQCVNRLRP